MTNANHFNRTYLITLLAAAGSALVATSSMAQSTTTYAQGDLLLGFRATSGMGAGSNVLVDLGNGSVAAVESAVAPITFNVPNLFSSLNGIFGSGASGWTTRSDVFWSVAGANATTSSTVYVTVPETVGGPEGTPWNRLSTSTQTGVRNLMNAEGGLVPTSGYNSYIGNTNPFGAGPAVIEGQTDTNSYGSYMPGGTSSNAPGNVSYGHYNPTIEGTFANGTSGITLDLIKLVASSTAGIQGQDLGDFTIDNSGNVVFTPDVFEVPEPSTYAMLGLGSLGLVGMTVLRRRRAVSV